ncbi:MAG: peptidylprolyl isomerase [Candidatus Dactylopiibacterium carminicum]|uniref:Peptidyl-prolyl cis-trans isomerase n=1 Tax=Candidatus Dactylopiibacterium carminicum TaxID=857335 RepID=A0A272EUY7_9RHOO|nr:FKBP-type peptidyl-prolyl cis-trans isomerase [Candidatus Dactylopiibacterium carminicum]KAF7599816.1 peptidylprolyl isomerase [Candidatus Dactylopiibacterium carminicum]PAS93927.1 MAG: peptidylprolyl isomerase [Candidatus Dactylopiibacterium carminicum]PAS97242.1 MAG: peptidylprolyl isomerase [Candidatus Dactylopiibacterium carminicum]PAS99818.1 MAG: peptidylprolyl isomerase [Candidatus Dactylopiibacterium carminicum]
MNVDSHSLVTLNVRIADADTGTVFHSSFESTPMTLQVGAGELMPALESRLIGLSTGARETLLFAPGEAFGEYTDALIERVDRKHVPEGMALEVDTLFSFIAPDGSRYPGLVRELSDDYAVIDFNHPLAGKAVSIEVEIIGVI